MLQCLSSDNEIIPQQQSGNSLSHGLHIAAVDETRVSLETDFNYSVLSWFFSRSSTVRPVMIACVNKTFKWNFRCITNISIISHRCENWMNECDKSCVASDSNRYHLLYSLEMHSIEIHWTHSAVRTSPDRSMWTNWKITLGLDSNKLAKWWLWRCSLLAPNISADKKEITWTIDAEECALFDRMTWMPCHGMMMEIEKKKMFFFLRTNSMRWNFKCARPQMWDLHASVSHIIVSLNLNRKLTPFIEWDDEHSAASKHC